MFAIVKRYYDKKLYSNEDVGKFVLAGKLTPDQYYDITGEVYTI